MLLLTLANAAYVVTAYVVTTVTARLLGPEDFGAFGVVMAWITVLTALLVKGLSTVIAREMATTAVDEATAWRTGRALGIQLSVALALVGAALSPFAARAFDASDLAEQFAIGALACLTFGTNAVLLAWPTGRRLYGRQAIAQVAYALARLTLVVGGAWIAGLEGAVVGYVLAPLLSSASIVARVPRGSGDAAPIRRRMLRGIGPVSLVSIAVSAYFVVDIFAYSAAIGANTTNIGIYVAYGTIAHVPYFLLQAASVVTVPALAAASAGAARHAAIRRVMGDTVVLLAGPTLLLATAGDAAARLVYGAEFQAAEIVLPLALATAAVTVINNLVAVDVAVGHVRGSLVITIAGACGVALVAWLVGSDGAGGSGPSELASAVLLPCIGALAILGLHSRYRHGALVDLPRAARGVLVAAVASVPPLVVDDDLARTLVAAACGVAWLAVVLRLQLVDARRGVAPAPDA